MEEEWVVEEAEAAMEATVDERLYLLVCYCVS